MGTSEQVDSHRNLSKRAELFGIDVRTLAVTRIALATVLLYDLAMRFRDYAVMYADDGLFPISDVMTFYGESSWRWSFHFWSDSYAYQMSLFALAALFGVMLWLGLLTRLATIASWLFLVSIHTRAPVLVTGGDVLLSMMLFWGIFLPLGARASVDAVFRSRTIGDGPYVSVASAAMMLQVAFMYFFTGCSKCNDLWFSGQALQSVFANEMFVRPLGVWMSQFAWLLTLLTYGTLILELAGPWLLFCPWKTRLVRPLVLLCFVGLHIGIEATMTVVIFSFASLAALTCFIPGWIFDRLGWGGQPIQATDKPQQAAGPWRRRGTLAINATVLVLLVTVIVVNSLVYRFGPSMSNRLPAVISALFDVGSFAQRWDMFSRPLIPDSRHVAIANLRDGTQVDLLRGIPWSGEETPAELDARQPSQRWVQVMIDIRRYYSSFFRKSLLVYLAKQWNKDHPEDQAVDYVQLATIQTPRPAGPDEPQLERMVIAQVDLLGEGSFQNGQRHGHWVHRFPSGKKEGEGNYVDGKEDGRWVYWYEDGNKEGEGSYIGGQLHGRWVFYLPDGQQREATFDHGRLVPSNTNKLILRDEDG
jgi:hypothetical protein